MEVYVIQTHYWQSVRKYIRKLISKMFRIFTNQTTECLINKIISKLIEIHYKFTLQYHKTPLISLSLPK